MTKRLTNDTSVKQRVLLADDDPVTLNIAREALEASGFTTMPAETGVQVLAAIEKDIPDFILLDADLPKLDGFSACDRLRDLPGAANVPVIIMTGSDSLRTVEQAFSVRATDFVRKPVDWLILLPRMHHLLRAARTLIELEQSQARLLSAQKMAKLGYWDWSTDKDALYLSEEARQMIGCPDKVIEGVEAFLALIYEEDRDFVFSEMRAQLSSGKPSMYDFRVMTPEGGIKYFKSTGEVSAIDARQRIASFRGTILDITEQRRNEEKIRRMAFYDEVTGLHNRVAFLEELKLVLNVHKRMDTILAVFYLDLDDFKSVNDSLGHRVGDHLLKGFADRLVGAVRSSDLASRDGSSVVARLGGDEFVLLLTGLRQKTDTRIVAQRIQDSLARPFVIDTDSRDSVTDQHELHVGASIGIAVYPDDGKTAEKLIDNADTAMYAAKRAGKHTFLFYEDGMDS